MQWLSIIGRVLLYFLLPFIFIFRWVVIALGPVLHLGGYILSGMIIPLRFLAKFETIYIYLGVAALIGLVTGSILHLFSAALVSLFNLGPIHEEKWRSTASTSSTSERGRLEQTWQSSLSKERRDSSDDSLERRYAEWLEKNRGKRKEDRGLLGQTIIEEDDDSEDGF